VEPSAPGPPLHVLWTRPAPEETGVATDETIRFQLDRLLAADSAVRQAICVTSSSVGSLDAGLSRCVGGVLAPDYDPVDRIAAFRLTSPLAPNTRYNAVLVRPAGDDDPSGLRAIDGAVLEKPYILPFWTGDGRTAAIEPRRTVDFCDGEGPVDPSPGPLGILKRCSTGGRCHGPAAPTGPPPYGGVLPLEASDGGVPAAVRALIEHAAVATETATGPDPARLTRSARAPFAENMPYIDPKNPANSYLLYKLMIGLLDDGAPTLDASADRVEPWIPATSWQPPDPGEYPRLRAAIGGAPMPLGGTVPRAWAETVGAWIARGADPTPCP
jgi:hypothetical protein